MREKVFYSMVNAGCPILEMQSKKVSLEEIFLELTESEKKDDAAEKNKTTFENAEDAEKYLEEGSVPDNGHNGEDENSDQNDGHIEEDALSENGEKKGEE